MFMGFIGFIGALLLFCRVWESQANGFVGTRLHYFRALQKTRSPRREALVQRPVSILL